MIELIQSFLAGLGCGIVFALLKLPVPAPPVLAGVLGIIGIFVGYVIIIRIYGS